MKYNLKCAKLLGLVLFIVGASILVVAPPSFEQSIAAVNGITLNTNKSNYYLREKVAIQGVATSGGLPISDALVALEVDNPRNQPLSYRTALIGNPSEQWVLSIGDIKMWDLSYNPINTVKIGQTVWLSVTVVNPQATSRDNTVATLSLHDANMIPIQAFPVYNGSIAPLGNITAFGQFYVPKWACSGIATVYASVFERAPAKGGAPYLPEKSAQFYISRTQQGLFNYSIGSIPSGPQLPAGTYSSNIRLPPNPQLGAYRLYASVRNTGTIPQVRATNSSAFSVLSTPSAPTASFVYQPNNPYPNQTVTFDASSSSAEGFNDTIIKYDWNFGDGTPHVVKTGTPSNPPDPTVTHKFMGIQQYIVTLNVTDTENLWSATLKPITTQPTNPTAVFTYPAKTRINATTTFNATASLPGWSISKGSPAPIASYRWNFGDGNITTVSNPIIGHTYTSIGNFTVSLTVTDTANQQNSVSHIISAVNLAYNVWDINQDGKTDIKDLAIAAKAFGSSPGMPNWNPTADITGPVYLVPDGRVDVRDLALIAKHYGETQ